MLLVVELFEMCHAQLQISPEHCHNSLFEEKISLQIVPIQGTTKNSQVETERGSSIDSSSDELHGLIVYTHGCIDFFHS